MTDRISEAKPVIAVVRSMDDWHRVARERAEQIGLSRESIDALGGLAPGYASKLLCDPPMRIAGPASFFPMNGVLGMSVMLVEDTAAMLRVQNQPQRRVAAVRVGRHHWRNADRLGALTLVRYDEMCRAIDAAYEVDEVKHVRDKAVALEHYARQAKNVEAERRACEIRLRAERKAGQLLAEMDKGRPKKVSGDPTLSDLGVSRDQSSNWQKLARVPQAEFDAALADQAAMPTTAGIIRARADSRAPRRRPRAQKKKAAR